MKSSAVISNEHLILFEFLSYVTAILGVPIALVIYFKKARKERLDREYGTYNALDDKYLEFLNICLNHPDLDIYHIKDKGQKYSKEQKKRELIIFELLISILERAYLMYRDQGSRVKKDQWMGWNQYMKDWLNRPNFRKAWKKLGNQWDVNFQEHMSQLIQERENHSSSQTNGSNPSLNS